MQYLGGPTDISKVKKGNKLLTPTVDQAKKSENRDDWIEAMHLELEQLIQLGVFSYVENKPTEAAVVGTFFVLKAVIDANGRRI
jgi:hypothetical protein